MGLIPHTYYSIKPWIPRWLHRALRRRVIRHQRARSADIWPILPAAGRQPQNWKGWPEGKRFALVLTHDVEFQRGHDACLQLAELEADLGFRSAFNFVPERYRVDPLVLETLDRKGFEVGVHGLCHDGKLYRSREVFRSRAKRINQYLQNWGAVGFRSPLMHHNLDWIHDLNIEYDASTFDTDPFEPQPDGVGTIFPFHVQKPSSDGGYVELPYTLAQDSTLFLFMQEPSIDLWKKKLAWIAEHGGMAMLVTHPDYMSLDSTATREFYPTGFYSEFLEHIQSEYRDQFWHALPREVAAFWKGQDVENHVPSTPRPIWIDLDNSPHVPFFKPIIRELNRRGLNTVVTARDAFQVCELADRHQIPYHRIGHHYGKNRVAKVTGLVVRAAQLWPVARRERPCLAVSHGARSQGMVSRLLGIPSVWIGDYEYSSIVPGFGPTRLVIPSVIPKSAYKFSPETILTYPGIKEDIYVPDFEPDPSFPAELGLEEGDLVVTVRPPATEAHYHNPESEILFTASMDRLVKIPEVRIIALPRTPRQADDIRARWPDAIRTRMLAIPEHAVDGLSLLWWSDLVISGGGTMNREATALGIPVYSIFRGHIGAVDRHLSETGRLILLETVDDIDTKLTIQRRDRDGHEPDRSDESLRAIVDHIVDLVATSELSEEK